jgi:hypothetical protein
MVTERSDPWEPGVGFALDQVSDDDLAKMGVSRDDSPETIIAAVKAEALRQWTGSEELIEEMITQAQRAIDMYPYQRDEAMARFYGETMQDIAGEEVDGESILITMMMTIFKLAEERRRAIWLMDGNRRAPHNK